MVNAAWMAGRPKADGVVRWRTVRGGTTMSPGFDYADYGTGVRDELIAEYPDVAEMIREYTR